MGAAHLDGLVNALRRAGLVVPVSSSVLFVEAVSRLGDRPIDVYWAGRATLAHSPFEISVYDVVFRAWLLGESASITLGAPEPVETLAFDDADDADEPQGEPGDDGAADDVRIVRFSSVDRLGSRDLATLDDDERAEVDRLIAQLRLRGAMRRSRRRRPSRRGGGRPDLRRTLRAAMRTGNETIHRPTLVRVDAPRRVVVLVDVSGSMEPYSRALVRFAHAAVQARARLEVFALGTRLTRLTRALDTHDPDVALARVAAAVPDWSGGTRLGAGLRRFNDEWGTRGMARGAVIVVLSDGWDRGDVSELGEQMARLHRVAHRIVWVNPLKASEGYQPLAKGMAAALPFIDEFVEGHSFDSLDVLVSVVADDRASSTRSSR